MKYEYSVLEAPNAYDLGVAVDKALRDPHVFLQGGVSVYLSPSGIPTYAQAVVRTIGARKRTSNKLDNTVPTWKDLSIKEKKRVYARIAERLKEARGA